MAHSIIGTKHLNGIWSFYYHCCFPTSAASDDTRGGPKSHWSRAAGHGWGGNGSTLDRKKTMGGAAIFAMRHTCTSTGFFQNWPFWSFSFENHSRLKILFLACLSEIRFLNLTLITTERLLQSKSMFFVQISIYRQLAFYWLNLIVRIMSVEVPHMVQDLMPLDGLPLNHLLCWVLLWICVGIQTERVEDFNFTTQVCQSC